MKKFNNQFATQKLRQEMSVTGTGASFTPGTGEQMATNKAFKKKSKKEEKDVEPKLAAGKAKVYMKDKWGWKDAPSIPNRPSKGGFIYKQLFEELSQFVSELDSQDINEPEEQDDNEDSYDWFTDTYTEEIKHEDKVKIVDPENKYFGRTGKVHDIHDDNTAMIIIDAPGNPTTTVDISKLKTISGINESYSKFKTETKTRGKSDQFHQAVRQVRKKVQEINKLFEYVSRLKSELSEGEEGLKYKVHTERALEKIKEMVSELNQNIKKFK